MGDFRTELIMRTAGSVDDIVALQPFEGWLAEDVALGDDWWRCSYDYDPQGEIDVVTRVARETRQPVLLGSVMDSDSALITGAAPKMRRWSVGLGLTSLTARAEEQGVTLRGWGVVVGDKAVQRLQEWSTKAGLTPDLTAIEALLQYDGVVAGENWDAVQAALGLPGC